MSLLSFSCLSAPSLPRPFFVVVESFVDEFVTTVVVVVVVVVPPIVIPHCCLVTHHRDVLATVTVVIGVLPLSLWLARPHRGRQEWHQEASQPMESVRFRHRPVRAH